MRMIRARATRALLVAAALLIPAAAQAAVRVATVDMALVYKQYPEVIKTTYFLKQKKDEFQAEIDRERRKIEEISDELKQNRAKYTDAQIRDQENKKRRQLFELQTKFQRYKEKLQDTEQEEFEKIRDAVKNALARLARTRRIEMVIEKQWLYFGETEDLTAQLITALGGEVPASLRGQ